MHSVFLGVVNNLLSFWFSTNHSRQAFNIRKQVSVLNMVLHDLSGTIITYLWCPYRLRSVTPGYQASGCLTPSVVRLWSLTVIFHWKGRYMSAFVALLCHTVSLLSAASEYHSWLLFYSLPVLDGILPEPYLHILRCW